MLCVEGFRLKTGQENYSVDCQHPWPWGLSGSSPTSEESLLTCKPRSWRPERVEELCLSTLSQTVNLSLLSGKVIRPSRHQPETRRNNTQGNFFLSLHSRFSGDGGKDAAVSRLCEPCFGGGGQDPRVMECLAGPLRFSVLCDADQEQCGHWGQRNEQNKEIDACYGREDISYN